MSLDSIGKVRQILDKNWYMCLATSQGTHPWASPVFYAVDVDFSFVFFSAMSSRHCSNIRENPNVSISVFNSCDPPETTDGVQIEGTAEEIHDATRAESALDVLYRKRFSDERDRASYRLPGSVLTGSDNRRIYIVRPSAVYKLDDKSEQGNERVPIDISALCVAWPNALP